MFVGVNHQDLTRPSGIEGLGGGDVQCGSQCQSQRQPDREQKPIRRGFNVARIKTQHRNVLALRDAFQFTHQRGLAHPARPVNVKEQVRQFCGVQRRLETRDFTGAPHKLMTSGRLQAFSQCGDASYALALVVTRHGLGSPLNGYSTILDWFSMPPKRRG